MRQPERTDTPVCVCQQALLELHPKSCFFIHNRGWIKVLSSQNSAPITQCNSCCKPFYPTPLLSSAALLYSPLRLISVILLIRAWSWQAYGSRAKDKHSAKIWRAFTFHSTTKQHTHTQSRKSAKMNRKRRPHLQACPESVFLEQGKSKSATNLWAQ